MPTEKEIEAAMRAEYEDGRKDGKNFFPWEGLEATFECKRKMKVVLEAAEKVRVETIPKGYSLNMTEYYNGYAQAQADGVGKPLTDDKDVQIVINIQKERIKEAVETLKSIHYTTGEQMDQGNNCLAIQACYIDSKATLEYLLATPSKKKD